MALPHISSGDIVDLSPLGEKLHGMVSHALVKTDHLELIRLILPTDKRFPMHQVKGEITIHCLEGVVAMEVIHDERKEEYLMTGGQLLYLAGNIPHALHAREDASLLVTILLPRKDEAGAAPQ